MRGLEFGEILFFSLFVLVPALFLTAFPPKARWFFFLLGVAFVAALGMFGGRHGPHDPALLLPLLGLGVAAGALIVEAIACPIRMLRRRRAAARCESESHL